jgi:hypothetical protein
MNFLLVVIATGVLLTLLEAANVPGAWWIGLAVFVCGCRSIWGIQ